MASIFLPLSRRSKPVRPAELLARGRLLPDDAAGHRQLRVPRAVRARGAAGLRLRRRHLRQRLRDAQGRLREAARPPRRVRRRLR